MKKREYFVYDYNEFQRLVNVTYGLPHNDGYEIACDEELQNDVDKSYHNVKKDPLSEYDVEKLEKWKASKGKVGQYMSWLLIQDMCNNDVIPPGDYLIQISW